MSEFKCLFSLKVDNKFFKEIGYFGKGTWIDAKEFSKNNSEGWRLPTREEMSCDILTKHNNRHKDSFSVWTCEEYNENAACSGMIIESDWSFCAFRGCKNDCKKSPLHLVLVR